METESDPWQKPHGPARRLVFDGLTRLDASGLVQPALAVSWKSEDADHRWQFQLRSGVHFHDGSALTASAVAASLTESCATNCPWTAVRAAGSTIAFTSDSPAPNLAELLAGDAYLIEHPSANGGVDGTGPFQTVSFSGGLLTLAANDDCWAGRPFVDSIEMRTRRAIHDQWIDLEAGRADLVEAPAETLRVARQRHFTVIESRPETLLALVANPAGPLRDLNLRRAISLALDRGALFNVIFQKQGEVTASLLPDWMTGYAFLFSTDRDLNKAHELRGGASPPALTISVEGSSDALTLAAGRLALNLREAGFNVREAGSGAQPSANNSPADLTLRLVPMEQAQPGAAIESLRRVFAEPSPVSTDSPEARYRAERDFLENATVVPLLFLPRAYAVGGRVRDLRLNADGSCALADVSLADAAKEAAR
jgi:MarR-like DNA-binding transcriptional regulator SgrR of sgrS sRNA